MTDDRRERYLSIIRSVVSYDQEEDAADAVMAVADGEISRTGELLREASSAQLAEQQAAYQALAGRAAGWVEENARLRAELEEMAKTAKANHGLHGAAHDEAARHAAAIKRVECRLTAWEQKLPEVVNLAPIIETVRRDLGIEEAPGRPAEDPPCAECGHPKADHQDADEPVSVGLCTACDEDDSDDAHHNYDPVEEA